MSPDRLHETGVDRSFEAILSYAGEHLPEGALEGAEQQGPIGYFSNHDSWATRIAGNGVALIGDAAGSPDPSHGHGTSLVFHDVRALSESLLGDGDWDRAAAGYATERDRVFDVIHQSDLWGNVFFRTDDDAARLCEGNDRAREHDPTLMGFSAIETKGPFGLVANEDARRAYFGLDLSW